MTDRTQPDSASTKGAAHIIRYALDLGLLWIDGDGRDKVREALDALDTLEAQLEAVGAGGVQALSAAPTITPETGNSVSAKGAAITSESGTPPAEQQAAPKAAPTRTALPEGWTDCTIEFGNDGPEVVAYGPKRMMIRLAKWLGKYFAQVIAEAAPKAAPGDALDEALRERDDAEDFIDATLDEVLGHERPEWSSSYGRADALNDVQERMTALHKPAVDKAWGQFQSTKAAPQQEAQEPGEIPESIERMATGRYKVVPSHESMFHRWAVVAGSGTQQLYLGSEVECQNMARKFAGAFLDGAFVTMQSTSPNPAPAPLSESIDQVERALAIIGVVGAIDGHDVVRRESVLEIARRAAIAAQGGK